MFNLDAVKLYAFSILFYSSAEHKIDPIKIRGTSERFFPQVEIFQHTSENKLPLLELTDFCPELR